MADFQVNPGFGRVRSLNTVLHGFPRTYRVDGWRTSLTLKSVLRGVARYRTPQGHFRVTQRSVALFNEGQLYSMDVRPEDGCETLCLFFRPGFVEGVARELASPAAGLLEDSAPGPGGLDFCERLYPRDGVLAARLDRLGRAVRAGQAEPVGLEEAFLELAAELVRLRGTVFREAARFPGRDVATRLELYRRLYRARDFLESCHAEPLSVAQAAAVACLSPFHFQRRFRQAFGVTPGAYLQRRRLEEAQRLLVETELDVTTVCLEVGFTSLGSFSALFRRRFGTSPTQARRQARQERRG